VLDCSVCLADVKRSLRSALMAVRMSKRLSERSSIAASFKAATFHSEFDDPVGCIRPGTLTARGNKASTRGSDWHQVFLVAAGRMRQKHRTNTTAPAKGNEVSKEYE
jgi:hypothetical protein